MAFDFNFILLLLQVIVISLLTLLALRLGKGALLSFVPLLAVCMNLFVLKQIPLLGLEVTCSEGLSVGYLLGCNLLQEFYGKKAAREALWSTFFITTAFMLLSQMHLLFIPSSHDNSQEHFMALFSWMPRIVLSSLACFLIVGFFDLTLFGYLKKRGKGNYLVSRLFFSVAFSQLVDTFLFSFMALYGVVEKIFHVIFFSFLIKLLALSFSTPIIIFTKRILRRDPLSV